MPSGPTEVVAMVTYILSTRFFAAPIELTLKLSQHVLAGNNVECWPAGLHAALKYGANLSGFHRRPEAKTGIRQGSSRL
jgi:hypothetical protein